MQQLEHRCHQQMAQEAYYQHRQYKQSFENYLLHRRRQTRLLFRFD
jgi:hypothetical protein